MDRDGRADLILTQLRSVEGVQRKDVDVMMSPAEPFSAPAFHQTLFGGAFNPLNHNSYVADLDGNGFPDLVLPEQYNLMSYSLNSGPPRGFGGVEPLPKGSGARANTFTTDIDADGTTEIMLRNVLPPAPGCSIICEPDPGIWYRATKISAGSVATKDVGLIDGSVFPPFTVCYDVFSYPCFIDQFVDLNGDGLPDVISINSDKGGNPWISINTGNGFHNRAEIHLASAIDGPSGQFPPYRVSGAFVNPGILVGNLNSDGRQDFIFVDGQNGNTHPVALLGGEDGVSFQVPFYLKDQNGKYLPLPDTPYLATLADVNGDGIPDLLEVVNGELHVYLHLERLPDVIKRVVEGTKEDYTISWAPISDPDVHQRTQTTNCSFPTMCQNNGIWVFSDVASFDGAGGSRQLSYQYQDARADGLGRGWLGFAQRQETDSATGVVSVTTYDNSTRKDSAYPFAGLTKTKGFTVTLDNGHVFSQQRSTSYEHISTSITPVYSVLPREVSQIEFESPISASSSPQRQITTRYWYDAFGNPTTIRSMTGDGYVTATSYRYDNRPDAWLINLPVRVAETQTAPSRKSVTRTTAYNYDPGTGALLQETVEPLGDKSLKLSRRLFRDKTGLITSIQETSADQQRITVIGYDNLENASPAYVINALLQIEQYAYHPSFGVPVTFRDENNNSIQRQIDGFGRLRSELSPDEANVTISYGSRSTTGTSYTITTRKAGGQEIESIIDRLGRESDRLQRGFDGRQIVVNKFYDSAGRMSQISNPYYFGDTPSGLNLIAYDALGRVRKITNPDGSFVEQEYSGLVTSSFDENRNEKRFVKDQLQHIVLVGEQADNGREIQTRYTYRPFGLLESVTDSAGDRTQANYDTRGRRVLLLDPDSGRQSDKWNAFSEIVGLTNALGNHLKYRRDLLGRPVKIRYKEGVTSILWDQAVHGIGKIAKARSLDGITSSFNYDALSRLSSQNTEASGRKFTFSMTYDSVGRLAAIRYPSPNRSFGQSPFVISFDYTPYGSIRAVDNASSGSAVNVWQNSARNAFDEITAETFGNGDVTSRKYDPRGRLIALSTMTNRQLIQDLSYEYYANGNLKTRTDALANVVEGYKYDLLNRLVDWDIRKNGARDLSQEFKYDDIGNLRLRTTLFGGEENLIYEYSGIQAGPHAVTSVNDGIYSYDRAGREKTAPGRRSTYLSWGLPSRIAAKGETDNFKYDFQYQRVLKTNSHGGRSITVGGLFEQISKGSGRDINIYYVPGSNRIVAARVEVQNKDNLDLYLHDDRLGSIATVTSSAGSLVDSRAYDPFGTRRQPADPSIPAPPSASEPPLGFTARDSDSEAGLVNMLGRLYDAKIGRFVSPDPFVADPLSSQSYNRYSYVLNNPLRWTDPTGLQVVCVEWCLTVVGDPSEWEAFPMPLPAPPLVNALDPPVSPPPLLLAGVSDDTGLTPPQPNVGQAGPQPTTGWVLPPSQNSTPLDPNWLRNLERQRNEMLEQEARLAGELPQFAISSRTGYEYRKDTIIGNETSDGLPAHIRAMMALQGSPNDYFPFDVRGLEGETGILEGHRYILENRSGARPALPRGENPVTVTKVTAESFTFTVELPGHFDPEGSTITFRTWADVNGNVHLEQYAKTTVAANETFMYWFAPTAASFVWDIQAANLAGFLKSVSGPGPP